jgi:hypothetical protein
MCMYGIGIFGCEYKINPIFDSVDPGKIFSSFTCTSKKSHAHMLLLANMHRIEYAWVHTHTNTHTHRHTWKYNFAGANHNWSLWVLAPTFAWIYSLTSGSKCVSSMHRVLEKKKCLPCRKIREILHVCTWIKPTGVNIKFRQFLTGCVQNVWPPCQKIRFVQRNQRLW